MTAGRDRASLIVRRASPEDIEAVVALAEAASGCAHWTAAAYLPYCDAAETHAEALARALFVAAATETIPASGSRAPILGFAAFSALPGPTYGECELDNMAVDEAWRRHGIGRRLLHAGLEWSRGFKHPDLIAAYRPERARHLAATEKPSADAEGPAMRLEVRAGNRAAIAFYRSAGFIEAGRRRGYYSHPEEDALLMRLPLSVDASAP